MLSPSTQDYLKTIYQLTLVGNAATTNDIAKEMNVAAASVTNMIKRLANMKMLEYASHRGVVLTDGGRKIALEMLRHHRLLELYLAEMLGYSLDKVHDEAEHLEHHISEEFEAKIAELLGHPEYDPHGDPIPSIEGILPPTHSISLTEISTDECVVVRRIVDRDAEMLRYLMQLGLVPKQHVKVLERIPFDGGLHIEIGDMQHTIGMKVASQVFVEQVDR